MKNKRYGEIKTKKNFFPNDARDLVKKGRVGILVSQCKVSKSTKEILSQGNITLYEGVESEKVNEIREKIKEKLEKEKQEKENREKEK